MRKFLALCLVALLAIVLVSTVASAQSSQPASKVTAAVSTVKIIDNPKAETGVWTPILSNKLKTANQKDLFIDTSLECGVYTKTLVKSKAGVSDTSSAQAGVLLRVMVDGNPAYPGEVTFCDRYQELSATLGGYLTACPDGTLSCLTAEEISLVLKTMDANSFNFVINDLLAGTHTVEVQAKLSKATAVQSGVADAYATIGKGSVTVEEVRMIQNEDFVLP